MVDRRTKQQDKPFRLDPNEQMSTLSMKSNRNTDAIFSRLTYLTNKVADLEESQVAIGGSSDSRYDDRYYTKEESILWSMVASF